jgi:hypothetical protein
MRLQFIEYLEQEQRVALVAAIVRRMTEMDLLVDEATKEDPTRLAHRIVGSTDMTSENQLAMANAVVAVAGKLAERVASITSERVAPTVTDIAKKAGQLTEHLPRRAVRRYTTTTAVARPGTLITKEEVNNDDQ